MSHYDIDERSLDYADQNGYERGLDEAGLWRPIETAPRDETWLLLWFTDTAQGPEPIVKSGFWSTVGMDWFGSECDSNPLTGREGEPPTHWLPMPNPPE